MTDETRAWALSANAVQRTSNGGASWTTYVLPTAAAADIDFVSATRGWLVGGPSIYTTSDAGQTWAAQHTGAESDQMRRVVFVDAQHGWAMVTHGGDQRLLRTLDGGAMWDEIANLDRSSANRTDISFVDALHGWNIQELYYDLYEACGGIRRTVDGGIHWQVVRSVDLGDPCAFYTAVDFLNTQEGWVAGTYGLILHTTDSGTTWQEHRLPSRITLARWMRWGRGWPGLPAMAA